jgi:4'-phosphopantetheinyl transferase EntD
MAPSAMATFTAGYSPPARPFPTFLPATAIGVATSTMCETVALPAEERLIEGVGRKRSMEFRAGRHAARLALHRLGVPVVPILRGEGGQPWWPPGVVGSITHCASRAAAVVAMRHDIARLGIDVELNVDLDPSVAALICTGTEASWCGEQRDGVAWETVIFSAKEAVYKALYPLDGQFLEFDDLELVLSAGTGTFHVRPLSPRAGSAVELEGRFCVEPDVIWTAAWCSGTIDAPPMGDR